MNRVHSIRTDAKSPLGAHTIGGESNSLRSFDLILIRGPNGSGKTTLVNSLCDVRNGVEVMDEQGALRTLDKIRDVSNDLLCSDSPRLMGKFKNLGDALAKASGVSQLRQEAALLEKLIPKDNRGPKWRIDKLLPAISTEKSAIVQEYLTAMLDAEDRAEQSLQGAYPLTIPTYNALGFAVAKRLGKTWHPVGATTLNEGWMRNEEEKIRPEIRSLPGDAELGGAIEAALQSLFVEQTQTSVDKWSQLETDLQTIIANAKELLPPVENAETASLEQWLLRCNEGEEQAKSRAAELSSRMEHANQLRALQERALYWLKRTSHHGTHCPLCQHEMAAEEAALALEDTLAHPAPELEDWSGQKDAEHEKAQRFKQLALGLEGVRKQRAELQHSMRDWLQGCCNILDQFTSAAQPATHWDPDVRSRAETLIQRAKELEVMSMTDQADFDAGSMRLAIERLVSFKNELLEQRKQQQQQHAQQQKELGPALQDFEKMQKLRVLLLARQKLNQADWKPTWERERAHAEKQKIIARWHQSIQDLIDERKERENQLQTEVLENPEVKARFSALLERIDHPLLQAVDLRADGVHQGDENHSGKLSEGYRVLVNLSAFMAVAGYVCEGQEHQAGWVVLDEPTNALDPAHRTLVAQYLGGLSPALMQRQIFITTYEEDFCKELVAAAKSSGRKLLEVRLASWQGSPAPAPTLHD